MKSSPNAQGDVRKRLYYNTPEEKIKVLLLMERLQQLSVDEALLRITGEESEETTNEVHQATKDERGDKLTFNAFTSRLRTTDDLIEFHNIDTEIWMQDRIQTKYYEQGAKLPDGTIVTTPLHGMTINFKRKDKATENRFEELKTSLLSSLSNSKKVKPQSFEILKKGGIVPELMITDLHLGKIAYGEDENYNWSNKECKAHYIGAIQHTINQVKGEKIKHFVLPTGNDFLNIDSPLNTTTKGTPQMTGQFYEKLFMFGASMLCEAIDYLSQIAPVYVPFVPGNHDANSTFHLGEVTKAIYRNNPNVHIDSGLNKRKYHSFDDVVIGYYHFDQVKQSNAYKSFFVDVPHLSGKKYKAIHGGHYHKNSKRLITDTQIKNEDIGIEIEVCPSLTPTDRWHYEKLFTGNLQRSKSFIWSGSKGLIQELYYQV